MKLSPSRSLSGTLSLLLALPLALGAESLVVGTSEPVRRIEMSFPESGVIADLYVEEGDEVEAGEVLARLDTEILEASLRIARIKAESKAAEQSAQANWDMRKRRLDELEALAVKGSANRQEVERAAADFAVADAGLQTAREEAATFAIQAEQIAAQIERRTLRSPVSGVVERIHREVAENADAMRGPVLTVVQLDQLHLVLHVDYEAGRALATGQEVAVQSLDGEISTMARVEFVSPVTDAASGTTRIKLALDNRDGSLRAGQKYTADLTAGAAEAP